jgi:hypothetical protein
MAIIDSQKVDFLWKKVIFGATNTSTNGKQGYEEAVGSKLPVFAGDILSEIIPTPAPNATGAIVQYYGTSTALRFTVDPTVAGNKSWFTCSTYNNLATRIGDWVPPSIDPGYLIEVYKNDATVLANKLNQGTSNNEWVFDYQSGVLTFPNTVPTATSLWIVAHRYIGGKGIGGGGVNIADKQVVVSDLVAPVSSGTYDLTGFFTNAPQSGTVTVEFNGVRLNVTEWTIVSSTTLRLDLDVIPYDLENGDVISAQYAWKS